MVLYLHLRPFSRLVIAAIDRRIAELDGQAPPIEGKPIGGSAGAMISSLLDLDEYVRVLCTGGLLRPETQRARMEGQALNGTTTQYGEGVITGPGACGHSVTVPGFGTDMYYFAERNATLIINVNRLDRDDKPQTSQVVKAVSDTLAAQFDRH